MNKVVLLGRLTKAPEIRHIQNENHTIVARFTLAVDRRGQNNGESSADFISCVAFEKCAEFSEKYLTQGKKIAISGHLHTGSYIKNNGSRVYTTEVVIEEIYFADNVR